MKPNSVSFSFDGAFRGILRRRLWRVLRGRLRRGPLGWGRLFFLARFASLTFVAKSAGFADYLVVIREIKPTHSPSQFSFMACVFVAGSVASCSSNVTFWYSVTKVCALDVSHVDRVQYPYFLVTLNYRNILSRAYVFPSASLSLAPARSVAHRTAGH